MKQAMHRITERIDALSLRERVIVFALLVLVLSTLANVLILDRQFAKQKELLQSIRQDEAMINGMKAEIQQAAARHAVDPDAESRARLQQLQSQVQQMHAGLREAQLNVIPPERIAAVLEDILKQHGKMRLVSLRTLPPVPLIEEPQAGGKADAGKQVPALTTTAESRDQDPAMYKHGVEIKLQGTYADFVSYLSALEALKWQFFWGGAGIQVAEYPSTTLTLTLYTLSLDRKWMNL